MSNKNIVRLTESDLKKVIIESIKKVLSEGKYTNNKPYFLNQDYNGNMYEVLPGQKAKGMFDDREEMEEYLDDLDLSDLGYSPEETEEFKRNTREKEEKRFKHNDRLTKYGWGGPQWGEHGDTVRAVQQRAQRLQKIQNKRY